MSALYYYIKHLMRYTLVLILTSIVFQSCSLEEESFGEIKQTDFPTTAEEAASTLAYAYAVLPELGYYSRSFFYATHLATEEFTQDEAASISQINLDNYAQDSNNEETQAVFFSAYQGINRANFALETVPKVIMNDVERDNFLGEAHFLRALHYYNLVRLFGKVPVRILTTQGLQPLSSVEEIYSLIIDDLEQAALMISTDAPVRGKANIVAAQGLLANVYLFLASAGQHTDQLAGYEFASGHTQAYYDSCALFANKVINEQSFFGFNEDLLAIYNAESGSESESIFEITASRTEIGALDLLGSIMTPRFDMRDAVLPVAQGGYTIGFGFERLLVEDQFYATFDPEDARKALLFADSVTIDGQPFTVNNGMMQRPFVLKYLDINRQSGGESTGNKYLVVRYSEVLLTYAEAVGPTVEGYESLNKIRLRAGLAPISGVTDVAAFRELVYEERTRELAFEFQHLFDLRRLGKMESVLEGVYGKNVLQNAYYYSLPLAEIDLNSLIKAED